MRIEDYALIGDCETAALVGRDGSVDWLCWPRFDSGACFAALLGDASNGRWLLRAKDEAAKISRHYEPDTLILVTDIETADGAVTVTDFMPPRGSNSDVVRMVTGRRGTVRMHMEVVIRFDYGSLVPWVRRRGHDCISAIAGPDMVVMRSSLHLRPHRKAHTVEFDAAAGETHSFVFTYGPSHLPLPPPIDAARALEDTRDFWAEWSKNFTGAEQWSPLVLRSLITLKALTYRPTGGIVAAPTTSLPEQLGGERNWDYRFCWIRDATLTLLAMMNGGFYTEADEWRQWLLRAIAGDVGKVQIMYGIAGERRLLEWTAPWLAGYEGSRPVRLGNAAAEQLQLDIYGELMDALYQARKGGLAESPQEWALQRELLRHLEAIWQDPDEGIWEVRGGRRHFVYSKVMTWVAFDRAIRTVEEFGTEGPIDEWKAMRERIHRDVCEKGYDAEVGSFTQFYGSKSLDASLLLIPLVGFLPPSDPRIRGTIAAIERDLMPDGFVLRYDPAATSDGLKGREGAFLACSFWLADCFTLIGRRDDAVALFERLAGLCNDVGLLSEEYDGKIGRMVGNFPQAFSHVSLVNTACNLARSAKPIEQRSGHKPA